MLDETLHELNIPLATITANAKMLSLSTTEEKSLERINRIIAASKNLQKSISILDSHIRDEISASKTEYFDGNEIIKNIAIDFCEIYPNCKIKLDTKQFLLETDEYEFIQSIRNILHNAIKFSNSNGDINIVLQNSKLIIKDSGKGIEVTEIATIFERYYQEDSSNSGSGIGLFIVKRYCDKNNIKIFIEQNKPQGTIVTLDLESILYIEEKTKPLS